MLHIILIILKIIGIVLLCLLGFLLLLTALILFVPIRYRADGSYIEKKLKAGGRVTWLLHIVSVSGFYDGTAEENKSGLCVKLFGIRIVDTTKKTEDDSKQADSDKEKSKKREKTAEDSGKHTAYGLPAETQSEDVPEASANVQAEPADSTVAPQCASETVQNGTDAAGTPAHESEENKNEKENKNEEEIVEHTKKRKTISERFSGLKARAALKVSAFKEKAVSGFEKLSAKVTALCRKKDKLMTILFSEKNRPAYVFLKRSIFKIIRHILPQRIEGWVHFGMDDPEKTGRMLGRIAVFYPFYAQSFKIAPDFENEVFETKLLAVGRIQAFTLAATGIKIILNKDLRRILSELRHL